MFTQLNLWAGAAGGFIVAAGLLWVYDTVVDDPAVVRETTRVVEAQAEARTIKAIGEVSDAAQKARAMRRYCLDSGMQYDFTTGKCR